MAEEETYNPYEFAKGLGFSDEEAGMLARSKDGKGQDATQIRRLAIGKGLLPELKTKSQELQPPPASEPKLDKEPSPHRHYYRKDGTCVCGRLKSIKK